MKTYPKLLTAKYYEHDINGSILRNAIIVEGKMEPGLYFTEKVEVKNFDEEERFYQSLPEGNYVRVESIPA